MTRSRKAITIRVQRYPLLRSTPGAVAYSGFCRCPHQQEETRLAQKSKAASRTQMSGMRGVYLVAAELVRHNMIVSVTSRSAAGTDLLATTPDARKAWSVQVKASTKDDVRAHARYFLLGKEARSLRSPSHVYVFVSIRRSGAQFYVVPSRVVAKQARVTHRKRSTWYSWYVVDQYRDAWQKWFR